MNNELNLYGIPNCNTVKQARSALAEAGWQVCFYDLKKVGVAPQVATHWLTKCDWRSLINRQGTTWRQLSDAEKDAVTDAQTAVTLMQKSPSVIKRPVICWPDGEITVGWGEAAQNKMSRP